MIYNSFKTADFWSYYKNLKYNLYILIYQSPLYIKNITINF